MTDRQILEAILAEVKGFGIRMDGFEGRMDGFEGRMDDFEGRMDRMESVRSVLKKRPEIILRILNCIWRTQQTKIFPSLQRITRM